MKTLKYLFFMCFVVQHLNAQSITIDAGASIDVGVGADICATTYGNITGTLTGDGTQCGSTVPKILNLVALIEGFYNGSSMVSDVVTVQLRNTSSPYALVEQKDVTLSTAGAGSGSFTTVLGGAPYYLVVRHRNSIETWSAAGQSFVSNSLSYDFTTAANKAYGNNLKLKSGKYCFYSGDVNQDGFIDGSDYLGIVNNWEAGDPAMAGDTNGDQFIDGSDYLPIVNNWEIGSITPPLTLVLSKPSRNTDVNKNTKQQVNVEE